MSLRVSILAVAIVSACPPLLWAQAATDPSFSADSRAVLPVAYQQPEGAQGTAAEGVAQPRSHELPRPVESSAPVPLKPRAASANSDGTSPSGASSLLTVGFSLIVVLGVFLLIVWLLRRASPHHLTPLPNEVFELLGRASLANRQQVQLLRCGGKVLLVSSSTPGGVASTLTEITQPDEVERIVALCRRGVSGAGSTRSGAREVRDA